MDQRLVITLAIMGGVLLGVAIDEAATAASGASTSRAFSTWAALIFGIPAIVFLACVITNLK